MKKRMFEELKSKNREELKSDVIRLRKEINKLFIEKTGGKVKKTDLLGKKRREIARILTIIRQKEMEK